MGAGEEGSLSFGEAAEVIGSLPAGVLMAGMTASGEPVTVDLAGGEPHVLVSAGAGAGTSSLLRLLGAQGAAQGAELMVIDSRRSQRWARDLPGVRYYCDIAGIHEALVGLVDASPQSGRVVVVCEDLVATMAGLRQYWRQAKAAAGASDPSRSPAVTALGDLVVAGRQTGVHVIAAARSLGRASLREQFRARFLARYSPLTWHELVPEAAYCPAPSVRGRWVAALDRSVVEAQAVLVTEQEARRQAASSKSVAGADTGEEGQS